MKKLLFLGLLVLTAFTFFSCSVLMPKATISVTLSDQLGYEPDFVTITMYEVNSQYWKPGDSFLDKRNINEGDSFWVDTSVYYVFHLKKTDWPEVWLQARRLKDGTNNITARLDRPTYDLTFVITHKDSPVENAKLELETIDGVKTAYSDMNGKCSFTVFYNAPEDGDHHRTLYIDAGGRVRFHDYYYKSNRNVIHSVDIDARFMPSPFLSSR